MNINMQDYLGSSIMTSSKVTMLAWLNSFKRLISLKAVEGIPSSSFSSLKTNSTKFTWLHKMSTTKVRVIWNCSLPNPFHSNHLSSGFVLSFINHSVSAFADLFEFKKVFYSTHFTRNDSKRDKFNGNDNLLFWRILQQLERIERHKDWKLMPELLLKKWMKSFGSRMRNLGKNSSFNGGKLL